jgi:flagellar hook assembly protein FlgD
VPSNQLVVVSELEGLPLLAPLQIESPVLTPNGDGINDEIRVLITVFQLQGQRPLGVHIHDLTGRSLRELSFTPPALSGEHHLTWDGRDDTGELVVPGMYVLRVAVPTDANASGTSAVRTLSVVY